MAEDREQTAAAAAAAVEELSLPLPSMLVVCDGCGRPPPNQGFSLKRCTRCRRAAYHGVECQRRHYPLHKAECRRWSRRQQQQSQGRRQQPTATGGTALTMMVRVEERERRGKCLVAVEDIDANQLIVPPPTTTTTTKSSNVNEHPSAIPNTFAPMVPPVLFPERRLTHCAVCFQRLSSTTNRPIVLCDHARFTVKVCSAACQNASRNWLPAEIQAVTAALHKHFAQRPSVRILPSALLLYRILVAVSNENDKDKNSKRAAFVLNWHDDVLSMQTHAPGSGDGDDAAATTTHRQAALILVSTLLPETPGWSSARMRQLERCFHSTGSSSNGSGMQTAVSEVLNRMLCNCFTLTKNHSEDSRDSGDSASGLGFGLFQAPANRINHSCAPGAAQSFALERGALPRLQIRALRPIAAGTEVCISYIDRLRASTAERRALLQQTYHFACDCPRCVGDEP